MSEHDPENIEDLRLTELYRSGDKTEPPAKLDQAVLALAAKKSDAPVWQRWSAPLATAAVLVLTVGVFLSQSTTAPLPEREPQSVARTQLDTPAEMARKAESRLREESAADSTAPLFADRQNGAPLAAAVKPAPPAAPREDDRRQSQDLGAAATTSNIDQALSEFAKRATAETRDTMSEAMPEAMPEAEALPQARIEEIIVTAGMKSTDDEASIYTTSEDCPPSADRCDVDINHPDCPQPYRLPPAAMELDLADEAVYFETDDAVVEIICEAGDWIVEEW